jgi:hypothetical protein
MNMKPPSSLSLHARPEALLAWPSKSAQADLEPRPAPPRGGRPLKDRQSRIRGGKLDAIHAVCFALLLMLLAGCGPGIGGTGTGAAIEPPSGLVLKPVCESGFADLLRCTGLPGTTASALGTSLSLLADNAGRRDALLRLEGNAADLEVFCAGLQFSGNWGQLPGQAARFHGVVRSVRGVETQYASLTALRSGAVVVVQLFDIDGRALSAPLTLQVVATAPAVVQGCP